MKTFNSMINAKEIYYIETVKKTLVIAMGKV